MTTREPTNNEIQLFKTYRILVFREITGNPLNALGTYDEVAQIENDFVHIQCEITIDDVRSLGL